jgi:hypothetical protein
VQATVLYMCIYTCVDSPLENMTAATIFYISKCTE